MHTVMHSLLESCILKTLSFPGFSSLPMLEPGSSVALPLANTMWQLYVKPHSMGAGFCSETLEWKGVLRSHTTIGYSRECYTGDDEKKFRSV